MKKRLQNIKIPKFSTRGFVSSRALKIILAVILVLLIGNYFRTRNSNSKENKNNNPRVEVMAPRATENLDKTFEFPIKDSSGNELGKAKIELTKAEIRDQIIIEGSRKTTQVGRTFLIVNMKITNSLDKAIKVNSRDYIRLIVNGETEEKLAPDVHNDPLEVQAISTKPTRVGFLINDTDRDYVLQIGEIKGEKQDLELELSI